MVKMEILSRIAYLEKIKMSISLELNSNISILSEDQITSKENKIEDINDQIRELKEQLSAEFK